MKDRAWLSKLVIAKSVYYNQIVQNSVIVISLTLKTVSNMINPESLTQESIFQLTFHQIT